jgi:RNA polymerase sigma-70 factor (ECF subfamily)
MAAPDIEAAFDASEEALIESVRKGDEAAFQILYEHYFPRVYQFVNRRLRNRADTEETVQEVFVNLFSSILTFRGEATFAAWVFGITRRTIASRFKKKRAETVPLGEEDYAATTDSSLEQREPSPHEAYEYSERVAQLARALEKDLSEEQRQLFCMHHLQHRSIQEIAHSLRKSEDAIKSNLYRARRLLLAR